MITTLSEFINHQMKTRDKSVRAFADLVKVSPDTISRFADQSGKDVGKPSPEFLLKLAEATDTNPLTIFMLGYPELKQAFEKATGINASTLMRSQRIENLPDHLREAIDTIIFERIQFRETNKDVE